MKVDDIIVYAISIIFLVGGFWLVAAAHKHRKNESEKENPENK